MVLSAACIGIQAFWVKRAADWMGAGDIAFFRFLISFLLVQAVILAGLVRVRVFNWRLVLARGVWGGIGNLLYFFAIASTLLSNAIVLLYTYPIFVSLYSRLLGRQRLSIAAIAAFIVSFTGVGLIVEPRFDAIRPGDWLALASGMFVGAAIFSLRESRRTESAWAIFHYFNLIGLALSIPLLETPWRLPPQAALVPLAGVVVFSMLGQLLLTYAYRFCTASEGSVISMFGAVVGCLLGVLVLGETATSGFILGGLLVVGSGVFLTVRREP